MEEKSKEYKVIIPENMESGVYSNAISVHFHGDGCVLDFGYSMPNSNPASIKVVGRVNISHATSESLLKVLSNAILDWKNKNKK